MGLVFSNPKAVHAQWFADDPPQTLSMSKMLMLNLKPDFSLNEVSFFVI